MRSFYTILVVLLMGIRPVSGQVDSLVEVRHYHGKPGLNRARAWGVGTGQALVWTGTFIGLNQAWYKDYPRQSFHFFNDWPEWQQQDKLGHAWTTYHISRFSTNLWMWAGMPDKKAAIVGGLSGIAYLSIIEILDGFSAEWGFSTGDYMMNLAGAGLYTLQQLGWKEQRIQLKLSYRAYPYQPMDQDRAESLFGEGFVESLLKDYNAQTYWLTVNPRLFFPNSKWPAWLTLAIGHNARLMLGGRENKWQDESGNEVDRTDAERYRRLFLSFDIDLTRIPTRNKTLKTIFSVVNVLKIPAPTLEFDTRGGWKGHWLYY